MEKTLLGLKPVDKKSFQKWLNEHDHCCEWCCKLCYAFALGYNARDELDGAK